MLNMRPFRLVFATVMLLALMPTRSLAADGSRWISASDTGAPIVRQDAPLERPRSAATDLGPVGFDFAIHVPALELTAVKRDMDEFAALDFPNAEPTTEVGAPGLPVVRRLFVAPPNAVVTVNVSADAPIVLEADAVQMPLKILPLQAPIPKLPGAREAAPFDYNAAAYTTDQFAPTERAVVVELGFVHGQRLMMLELRPVAFNPVKEMVHYWPDLSAQIRFAGNVTMDAGHRSAADLERIVINPDLVHQTNSAGNNYLIVTADLFAGDITGFAAAKQAQGFSVDTYSVPQGTSRTVIKNYIQGLWGTADEPDHILLVGDTDRVPHWVGGGDGSPDTDLPYTCMDGAGDWYPDIAIGRFPADNTTELQTLINKTLYYENGPLVDPAYRKRAAFMASMDNYNISEGTHNYVINNYMDPFGYQADKLYQVTYGANTQDVRDALNDGRFYGVYSGHGSIYSWADGPPFTQSDINGLTNADLYAFICSFACITGTYTVDECFMETWVLAPNRGAVASWGSSVNSYWDEDDILEKRLFDTIFDNTDDVPSLAGPVYNEAKLRFLAHYGPTSTTRRYFEMYNLFGDPALPLPGGCTESGTVNLTATRYMCEDTATIEVADCDLNFDDGAVETAVVTVKSDSELGGEVVTLYETDVASAIFAGSIPLSTVDAPGVLAVTEDDVVTATYTDADDGQGGVNVRVHDTAVVDCTAPQILDVTVSDIQPHIAKCAVAADESVRATVRFGPACYALEHSASSGRFELPAVVLLDGLTDDTTYFFAVDAQDIAGNVSTDDNGGACYSFTTPDAPDYFTELFAGDNDLNNVSFALTPDGSPDYYHACARSIASLPTDPAGGTTLTLDDDDYAQLTLAGGEQVQLYGVSYSVMFPADNGYITFLSGDTDYTESLEEHFEQPRVSGLYVDFDPTEGGTVSWRQLEDRVAVTWQAVPEWDTTNSNTFQIVMYFDGRIELNYLDMNAVEGIAGVSAGDGLDVEFYESDLTAYGACGPVPPVASNLEVGTPIGQPRTIDLSATDDGLPDPPACMSFVITSLSEQILRDPSNDHRITAAELPYTLAAGGHTVAYEPVFGFAGTDSFSYVADDGGVAPDGGPSEEALVSISVGGMQTVHSFTMDTDPGWTTEGLWAFGPPIGAGSHDGDPDCGCTGDNVYGYNLAGDYTNGMPKYSLTTTPIDCSRLTHARLRFMRWLGVDSAALDSAKIEISVDGSFWEVLWKNSDATSDSSWRQVDLDISNFADNEPTVYIRWSIGPTDGSTTYPGWNIDDVEIRAVPPVPGDFDFDGDVDAVDFDAWNDCMTGPDAGPMLVDCCALDFDRDNDVDLVDYFAMMLSFNGP